jgi:Flp pilus assembly CpaE family ATPase
VDLDAFEALMDLVKKQFSYLLVDTQRDVSGINKICMRKADSFVIMVEMSVASAQNAARILELLNTEQPGKKALIVANKIGLSSGGALAKESFEKVIDKKIDYLMPLDESVALAAANIGQPLAVSNGPLTEVLDNIAEDILGKKESQEIAQALLESEGWTTNRVKNIIVDKFEQFITQLR